MEQAAKRPEKRQRTQATLVRWTPQELADLDDAASKAAMKRGAFIRHQTLGTAGPRAMRQPSVNKKRLAQALGQLGYVGNNVNQLARLANMGEVPRAREIAQAMDELISVSDLIRKALGQDS